MSRIPILMVVAALGLGVAAPAWACNNAEKLRLSDEIRGLAKKNAWAGVERKYEELVKTKCDIDPGVQLVAADSALNVGKTFERWERLAAANEVEPTSEVTDAMQGIETAYGRVHIKGDPRRRAPLLRDAMPFAPDQRKSIEWAQKVVEGTGSFRGMLPAGEYKVADKTFIVIPGAADFVEVQIGKARKGGDKVPVSTGDQPLINWIGPVAMAGVGFFGSPAPNKSIADTKLSQGFLITGPSAFREGQLCTVLDDNGDVIRDGNGTPISDPERATTDANGEDACVPTVREPGDVPLFGNFNADITAGLEVGLTYRKPEMGIVATVGYRRMFGNAYNQITVHGGLVVRPGDFRFTLGPTWGLVLGSGNGLASWVDDGYTQRYRGLAYGGGVSGSAGWAVIDVGPFQGIVDGHGHWMRDSRRNYYGFGLRLGIVPKIDRFEE